MMPESELSVQFSKLTLDRLRSPWRLSLMGKCMGITIRANFMEARVRAMWRVKGSLEVIDLGKNVFLFRFTQVDDYERALFGGPWFILDHYLMISTWRPNFRPSINQFDTMSVWIRIEELPVEYYDKEALFAIARVVGKPIRVDYANDRVARAQFARICVDIDLFKPLVTRVWVGGSWQNITYENIVTLCFKCGKIGHDKQNCRSQTPTADEGVKRKDDILGPTPLDKGKGVLESSLIQNQNNNDLGHNNLSHVGNTNNGLQADPGQEEYGPWVVVTNKRNTKSRLSSQKENHARINEYKKGSSSKKIYTERDTRNNVAESRVISSKTMVNSPSNEVNTETGNERVEGETTVHLANMVEHMAQDNDSPSNFSSPSHVLTQGVIQDNTSSSISANHDSLSLSQTLPSEASPTVNHEFAQFQSDLMHVNTTSTQQLHPPSEAKLGATRAQVLPEQEQIAGTGSGGAPSTHDYPTTDSEHSLAGAAGDDHMQDIGNNDPLNSIAGVAAETGGGSEYLCNSKAKVGLGDEIDSCIDSPSSDRNRAGFQSDQ